VKLASVRNVSEEVKLSDRRIMCCGSVLISYCTTGSVHTVPLHFLCFLILQVLCFRICRRKIQVTARDIRPMKIRRLRCLETSSTSRPVRPYHIPAGRRPRQCMSTVSDQIGSIELHRVHSGGKVPLTFRNWRHRERLSTLKPPHPRDRRHICHLMRCMCGWCPLPDRLRWPPCAVCRASRVPWEFNAVTGHLLGTGLALRSDCLCTVDPYFIWQLPLSLPRQVVCACWQSSGWAALIR